MLKKLHFYIDGAWVNPSVSNDLEVIDPSSGAPCALISLGNERDVDLAVQAAKNAFPLWSQTAANVRLDYVKKIAKIYERRAKEMAEAISLEMGAPIDFALRSQVQAGKKHMENFITSFENFSFIRPLGQEGEGYLSFAPIGVVGLITPWNWPMNQIVLKVIAALLAGCTMVLKPSEIAPLSALLFAEILHEAVLPKGVFNLVNGTGQVVGNHITDHEDIAMISFTGSTRAGKAISKNAANTLKKVTLELGGKGANLIFADADAMAVERGVRHCFNNSGQSCNAPTRMLVERSIYKEAIAQAEAIAKKIRVGSAHKAGDHIGPVISQTQYDKIQELIKIGIKEGAKLLIGGPGPVQGLEKGYFVQPTIFYDVSPNMRIFQEEIFGPVLTITPFDTEKEAIALANQTIYGLTNYIQSQNHERCLRVALGLASGMVEVNDKSLPKGAFFGGIKQSGYAREGNIWGIEEFLYSKAFSL